MKRPTLAQWLAQLSEFLPGPYVAAYADRIATLYADGATPGETAVYCRAFLLAPHLIPVETGPHFAGRVDPSDED